MTHQTAPAAAPSGSPSPPTTLSQALTQKIRELLQREGWSQRTLANRLGVTQGAVSYLLAEKRRASVLDYYERLASVFGMSLSILIADLEHRVGTRADKDQVTEGRGVPHATSAPAIFISAAFNSDQTLFRAVLQALIDARIEAASDHISARVDRALAELEARQKNKTPAPRKNRRRRAAPKKRPHHRAKTRGAERPPAGDGEALPPGRDSSGGSLRRTG
jgi:transcriptional regulator with XRE-family HTH domain